MLKYTIQAIHLPDSTVNAYLNTYREFYIIVYIILLQ